MTDIRSPETLDEFCARTRSFNQTRLPECLYEECGDILTEPLAADTFHVTLHDLISGTPSEKLEKEIERIEPAAVRMVKELSSNPKKIEMRSTFLFNMVSTSMVLGFEPRDEESCRILMRYYEAFQPILCLNYPLTPHVTLAYFKPGILDEPQIKCLQRAIDLAKIWDPVTLELCGSMLE